MLQTIPSESALLLNEIGDFIYTMNTISEEEAIQQLSYCSTPVLHWVLHEVAIPNRQYDLACITMEIIKQRKEYGSC